MLLLALSSGGPVHADSEDATSSLTQELRDQILDSLANHPDDPALLREGERLLEALESWDTQLHRSSPPRAAAGAEQRMVAAEQQTEPTLASPFAAPLPSPLAGLDPWNLNENYFSVGVAEVDWTIDRERYPGTKLALAGQYSIVRGQAGAVEADCDCPPPPVPHRMLGLIGFDFLWGDDDLEYSRVSAAGVAYQRNWLPEPGNFGPIRDTLEWGVLTFGHNDHLGIESYYELTVAGVGRTWALRPGDSNWLFTTGVGLSGGWAWAESVNPLYRDVSNPFAGTWIALGAAHPRWGKFQAEQRVIQGFTISNPSEGESTSREAVFRAAYTFHLPACLSGELSIEKHSFAFANFSLRDLYEKSRRVNLFLGCVW